MGLAVEEVILLRRYCPKSALLYTEIIARFSNTVVYSSQRLIPFETAVEIRRIYGNTEYARFQ